MFECLYCGKDQEAKESSLEHAVPQFLGGATAPTRFHLTNVCRTCNNRLGLFVDASYAKAWVTTNALALAAHSLCKSENDLGLPMTYAGHAKIEGLIVPTNYMAEHWMGPFGETVIWVRDHDERMDAYAGGNPINVRRLPSTIYFVPTTSGDRHLKISLNSLNRMAEKKKVRKVLCAKVHDQEGRQLGNDVLGFDLADTAEAAAVDAILKQVKSETLHATIAINLEFDHRFICKLALGVGFAIFGQEFLTQTTTSDLRRGVWPVRGEAKPAIHGVPSWPLKNDAIAQIMHYPGAVVLYVMKARDHWGLTLSVDPKLTFTVAIGPATMTGTGINSEEGYALVLVPYLQTAVELSFAELIAHRQGVLPHPDLVLLDDRRHKSKVFWDQMKEE